MTDFEEASLHGAKLNSNSDSLAPRTRAACSANARLRVSTLVNGVNGEIEQLRSRMRQLTEEPIRDASNAPNASDASDASDLGGQASALEELVHSLRQANEHLVIASLDAHARETQITQAHQRQSEFLSMLAHELRNPLAPITMGVELMGRMTGENRALQSVQSMLARQTAHLTRLVDDLLDATRISTGKIQLRTTPVLLSKLVAQAIETSQPVLDGRHQPLRLHLPPEPLWLEGDLVRLTQLLCNLIINASKFSDDLSPIDVTARCEGGKVFISVKDRGIGIAPERQPFVFDLFVQGPVAGGLRASGLGVGLSLVRTIAQLHGGDVQVDSPGTGHGSEFTVTLPLAAQCA